MVRIHVGQPFDFGPLGLRSWQAGRREAQLKRWSQARKEALIRGDPGALLLVSIKPK